MQLMQQVIETKIQELEEKKAKSNFFTKWWVQKIINVLKEILIIVLNERK